MPGYEIASWERGYGDFELAPDLATLRRIPWLEATALVLCDVHWADGSPVRPVAAPGTACAARARARALGFDVMVGSELEFYLLKETYEEAHAQPLPRPDAVGAVHPRLPHPRLDLRGAAAPADPERHGRRGHARRDLEGRGVAGPARDQLPLRRRAADGGRPRRLQERRQGDRAPERLLAHVHGQARPHLDRLVVPHPLVVLARRRERVRRRERRVQAVPRRADRVRARAGALLRARTSTRTSGSRPDRGRRRRSPGVATTAPAGSAWSVTAPGCASRPGSPAATSTRTWRSPR